VASLLCIFVGIAIAHARSAEMPALDGVGSLVVTAKTCAWHGGQAQEGESLDGQVITGGPFRGTMVWPRYTCVGGYWRCTQWCPAGAHGVSYRYDKGALSPVDAAGPQHPPAHR
jgi:hypothetical protein